MDRETDRLLDSLPESNELQYRVYRRRWFILAVISLINLSNGMCWSTFGPISSKTTVYYGITEDLVNVLSIVFLLCTVIIGFFAIWLLDFWGLRAGVLLGGGLNGIGNVLRLISCYTGNTRSSTAVTLLFTGQVLAACAQPFVLFTPTKVSTLWFPSSERAVANMLASMSNPIGIMLVSIIGSHVVTNAAQVELLIFIVTIPAVVGGIMAFIGVCSSVPPTPPSGGAEEQPEPFFAGLKEIFQNKHYMILWLVFGSGAGTVTAITALLQQMFCLHHYSQEFAGICLMLMYLFGFLGAVLISIYVDRTKKFEFTAKVSCAGCAVCLIIFTTLINFHNLEVIVAIAISAMGFCGFGAYPVALELSVESTFPIAQATSAGFIIMSSQIQGAFLMIIMTKVFGRSTGLAECDTDFTESSLFLSIVATVTAIIFIIFYKCEYRRLTAEQRMVSENLMSNDWPPGSRRTRNLAA